MRFRHNPLCDAYIYFKDKIISSVARLRGVVPSSFFVDNVEKVGDYAIGRGGFADVWKGHLSVPNDKGDSVATFLVALKVLRTFKKSTAAETLKQVSGASSTSLLAS